MGIIYDVQVSEDRRRFKTTIQHLELPSATTSALPSEDLPMDWAHDEFPESSVIVVEEKKPRKRYFVSVSMRFGDAFFTCIVQPLLT